MSRRYQEQIEVRLGSAQEHGVRLEGASEELEGVPVQFLWRGRVHRVRAVLAQWVQRVPWWRPLPELHEHAETSEDPEDWRGMSVGDAALEQRVWRVEAGAGRVAGTGVYDLVQGRGWWIERVSD